MKTAMFTPLLVDGDDAFGSSRLKRTLYFLEFYRELREKRILDFDRFLFVDNASDHDTLSKIPNSFLFERNSTLFYPGITASRSFDVSVSTYRDKLTRGEGFSYPYAWRYLYHFMRFMEHTDYERAFLIDTDLFVLSRGLASYINSLHTGWTTFWCPKYSFPECSLMVFCRDQLPALQSFFKHGMLTHEGRCMETALPYTHIEKHFVGDRYGEERIPQNSNMDFYAQSVLDIELKFIF